MSSSVAFGLMLLPWSLVGAHRAQPEQSECVMLQKKASKHLSPSSESNPVEIATLDEHDTVNRIGQESAVSTAEATALLVQESKLSVSPAEVTCGQVVPFQIEQRGQRYTPTITGANGLRVKLSTVPSSSHADTTLTDTLIVSPCHNDDVRRSGVWTFSECSFHAQEETVTVSVGGYGSRSGLAYLAVDCEEYIPTTTTTTTTTPDPVRCTEWSFWPRYSAPTCSECPTAPRSRDFGNPLNNGNNNGLCQGHCRWNNPSTHDTCVPIEEGASGYCPSECFQTSSREAAEICNVPDSYANKYSMPPGDRVCYHMCMEIPTLGLQCGDSSWYFNTDSMRPLWCCGCQPEGFQDGTDQCQILQERHGLIQTSNDVLDVESKEQLQDSGAGDKDRYQGREDYYGQDKDHDDQNHHGQDKH